jgi:putative Ca2+/H+ antiporter (TMEM165/GDT1 family)
MDWKLLLTTAGTIFLAELGDKTQILTMTMSAQTSAKWTVFAGAVLGLIGTSLVAVLFADAITRVVPQVWLERAAGVLFLVIGAYTLWKAR